MLFLHGAIIITQMGRQDQDIDRFGRLCDSDLFMFLTKTISYFINFTRNFTVSENYSGSKCFLFLKFLVRFLRTICEGSLTVT